MCYHYFMGLHVMIYNATFVKYIGSEMEIIELEGEDRRLYCLIAPLVMNEKVIAYNLNYPFRTSPSYRWFIAMEDEEVLGFIPLKSGSGKAVINNYYVAGSDKAVFMALLREVVINIPDDMALEAIVQTEHTKYFEQSGFYSIVYYKKFIKMRAVKHAKNRV